MSHNISILNQIYVLSGLSPPDCQDELSKQSQLLMLFNSFCNYKRDPICCQVDELLSNKILDIKEKDISLRILCWLPGYGCVMMCQTQFGCFPERMSKVYLVALDEWSFQMSGENKRSFYSTSRASLPIHCAILHPDQVNTLLSRFNSALDAIQRARTADKRSANEVFGNQGGHQRTPAFIESLIKYIVDSNRLEEVWQFNPEKVELNPKGAFTDVGQHTGGSKRNTTWGLMTKVMRLVFSNLIDDERERMILLNEMLIEFDIWVANANKNSHDIIIKWNMEILQAAVEKFYLTIDAFGISQKTIQLEQHLKEARDHIEKIAIEDAQNEAGKWIFPIGIGRFSRRNANIAIDLSQTLNQSNKFDPKQLLESLEDIKLFPVEVDYSVYDWANSIQESSEIVLMHKINYIEYWFFEHANILNKDFSVECSYVQYIDNLLEMYSDLIKKYQESEKVKQSFMQVELMSKHVLITWISYCLVHKWCSQAYPSMYAFSVSLDPKTLKHLALSDKSSLDATKEVVKYLNHHSKGRPIFSMNDHLGTFVFAEVLCKQDERMRNILTKEKEAAKTRVDKHWNEVKQKKEKAQTLINEISQLQRELSSLQEEEATASSEKSRKSYYKDLDEKDVGKLETSIKSLKTFRQTFRDKRVYNSYDAEISNCQSRIKLIEAEIEKLNISLDKIEDAYAISIIREKVPKLEKDLHNESNNLEKHKIIKSEQEKISQQIELYTQQITEKESEHQSAQAKFNVSNQDYSEASKKLSSIQKKISLTESNKNTKQKELNQVQKMPPPVYQPFPSNENLMCRILFWMYMTDEMDILAKLSFLSCTILMPKDCRNRNLEKDQSLFDKLRYIFSINPNGAVGISYYRQYHSNLSFQPVITEGIRKVFSFDFTNGSNQKLPKEESIGPLHIDYCNSEDEGRIWYPNEFFEDAFLSLLWSYNPFNLSYLKKTDSIYRVSSISPSDTYFNPFKINEISELISLEFTEKLDSASGKQLNWTLVQTGHETTPKTRSNESIAKQDNHSKPDWLSKSEYLTFCSIRSYPYQQIRKICSAFHDTSLPFNRNGNGIATLLKQSLYHIGDINPLDDKEVFLWKKDMFPKQDAQNWLDILGNELLATIKTYKNSPNELYTLLLAGELCGYVSQWNQKFREGRKHVALAMLEFSNILESMVPKIEDEKRLAEIKIKQCLYNTIGICVYLCGIDIDLEDARVLCKASVLSKVSHIDNTEELKIKMFRSRNVLSKLSSKLHQHINKDLSILTDSVQVIAQDCPDDLEWKQILVDGNTRCCCFETSSSQGNHYSINILSGIVLINGKPPNTLPPTITQLHKYKRVFGDRNFGITLNSDGGFTTKYAINGLFYSFFVSHQGNLIVKEENKVINQVAELLDPPDEENRNDWCKDLPIRLQMMHSHWVIRNQTNDKPEWIIFRGIKYADREVSFIARFVNGVWKIYRVPFNMKRNEINDLLSKVGSEVDDRMIFVDINRVETFINILEKFEFRDFIEVYESNQYNRIQIKVTLPRYERDFYIKDDKLFSNDYAGYYLSKCQQFPDRMYKFNQYLILEQEEGSSKKVLISDCDFILNSECKLNISAEHNGKMREYAYDIHSRLKYLKATSVASRLHLAAVYSSVNCKILERSSGKTGEESAIELIRQSWVNRPLTDDELRSIQRIISVSSYSCSILLLCEDLKRSANQLSFLHDPKKDIAKTQLIIDDSMIRIEYETKDSMFFNPRCKLTEEEEKRILFSTTSHRSLTQRDSIKLASRNPEAYQVFDRLDIKRFDVEDIEKSFEQLLIENKVDLNETFPIELQNVSNPSVLANNMVEGLKSSWNAFLSLPMSDLSNSMYNIETEMTKQCQRVNIYKTIVEDHVLASINNIPKLAVHSDAAVQFRLKKIVNFVPRVQLTDLLRIGVDKSLVLIFNPFLSHENVDYLHGCIRLWMELCVLEDKLKRMIVWARASDKGKLIKEIKTKRTWDSKKYMEWLAFEVEGQLQIRPIQYTVAKSLIDSIEGSGKIKQGMITQLNMGEGKTRVIIPMLMLYFTKKNDSVVRLHFLAQLINDAFDHLHQYLCASVLNRKIFMLPFNRDIKMNDSNLELILKTLEYCRISRGCICVTPESRLSMILKWNEAYANRSTKPKAEQYLRTILNQVRYIDVFDESDEILRHKLQLIYAIGEKEKLPSGHSRWVAAECALTNLGKLIKSGEYDETMLNDKVVVERQHQTNKSGAFSKFRMTIGNEIEKVKDAINSTIIKHIFADPPYEFSWMSKVSDDNRVFLEDFIANPLINEAVVRLSKLGLNSKQISDVRALRGVLAYGNLIHCLQGRHRVTYGTKENGEKYLAVPYRAADTPSERSEYSHPDIAIIYTVLSYYYDGLSKNAILESFKLLLKQGIIAKEDIYNKWYSLSKISMDTEDQEALDSIKKIDLSSTLQTTKLEEYFKFNVETINYWLNNIVFPTDTAQFPEQLISTAWHLCDNQWKHPVGFSGTDDNKILLPLQVKQEVIESDTELQATNGKMLYLLKKKSSYATLIIENDKPTWKYVIEHAVKEGNALIDAGGLMAGVDNSELAEYAVGLHEVEKAIVYFDTNSKKWKLRDKTNRIWPLSNSPIPEKDAFVYFDDSRCRGADMKLLTNAIGILTIGPKMCKDKLMQAAGRMRQLDQKQSIKILGTYEVSKQIRYLNKSPDSVEIESSHILQWVMSNTIDSVAPDGLIQWTKNGIHFCKTVRNPEKAFVPYDTTLETLYAKEHAKKKISKIVDVILDKWNGMNQSDQMELEIVKAIKSLGKGFEHTGTSIDDECERELEEENEQEEECENEIPLMDAAEEEFLDYDSLLNLKWYVTHDVSQFKAIQLSQLFQSYFKNAEHNLNTINWSLQVFCTKNFYNTYLQLGEHIAYYLRHVDAILYFRNKKQYLLLAEGEADHILKIILEKPELLFHVEFFNLSYLKHVPDFQGNELVSTMLLQGLVMYPGKLKHYLEEIIDTHEKQQAALQLLEYRDLLYTIDRSDLDKIQFEQGL